MEFTRLNTSTDGETEDGAWHLVIAPRARAESQQDGEFGSNPPRAHFLRPGSSRARSHRDASPPCTHDLQFEGGRLDDRPWDNGCGSRSFIPHPLAQPGFYSPKIPRSKYCEPALSTTQIKNTKEFCSHTLPLPRSKRAVLKQSELSCQPKGVQTSSVEKPRSMKASISRIAPDSRPTDQRHCEAGFHCIGDQTDQNQGFSSVLQRSPNLRRPEISKKEEFMLNHQSSVQTRSKQNAQVIISVKKCAPELHEISSLMPLQNQSGPDEHHMRLNLQSSGYCKLSLYNTGQESKAYSDGGNHSSSSQVDVTSKNVFGQPRVIATLRPACTPRPTRKSTVVEDLKKLIVMDDPSEKQRDSPSLQQTQQTSIRSPSEHLHSSASANPLIFHSPVLSKRPLLGPAQLSLQSDPTVCQPRTQLSETEGLERDFQTSHGLQPLTNPECEWSSLVDAAEAFESKSRMVQRMADMLSESPHLVASSGPSSPAFSGSNLPCAESDDSAFLDFPDHLSHLEAMLRRLSSDLLKEKKDKVALLAEVLKLRMSNQHLKEESLTANMQLRKICQLFNISTECTE